MLDSNGFISNGELILNDDELQETNVKKTWVTKRVYDHFKDVLAKYSKLEFGAEVYKQMIALKDERKAKLSLTEEENREITDKINEYKFQRVELFNLKQTYDTKEEKDKINEANLKMKEYD